MASDSPAQAAEQNDLLHALPPAVYERIVEQSDVVALKLKDRIYRADERVDAAYFPADCCLSMVSTMRDGTVIEVGTIGNEGMSGLSIFHGVDSLPTDCIAQIAGEAKRIARADLEVVLRDSPELTAAMHRYAQAWTDQLGRSAACNVAHTIDQRCARWLLMTHDRVRRAVVPLTQEFLAVMLGARRASVTLAANRLKDAQLIRYTRGRITILDRPGLEAAACECYEAGRRDLTRVLPPPQPPAGNRAATETAENRH